MRCSGGVALTVVLVGLVGSVAPAGADRVAETVAPAKEGEGAAPAPVAPRAAPPESVDSFSHQGMFEVSLRLALGLRAIVPYDKTDYCGASDSGTSTGNAPVCTGRSPFSLDLELGYGLKRRIDVFAELRLGIQGDFAPTLGSSEEGPRMLHISPGARFFFSDAKSTKLFTTAQLVFDFAGYKDPAGADRGNDFGIRNLNGLWLDLEKAYGFYAFIGETLTFSRWLRFELEAGIGVQARYR
ncbi:hypothetical protein BH11MYX3_BH11MYX3_03050 [soil metagenome]